MLPEAFDSCLNPSLDLFYPVRCDSLVGSVDPSFEITECLLHHIDRCCRCHTRLGRCHCPRVGYLLNERVIIFVTDRNHDGG
jgi:hypothetical protein